MLKVDGESYNNSSRSTCADIVLRMLYLNVHNEM